MNGKAFFGHLVAVVAEDLNLNYEFIAPKSFVWHSWEMIMIKAPFSSYDTFLLISWSL